MKLTLPFKFFVVISLVFYPVNTLLAQYHLPDLNIEKLSDKQIDNYLKGNKKNTDLVCSNSFKGSPYQVIKTLSEFVKPDFQTEKKSDKGDTLYVGSSPNDSIYVTGEFFHNGTIIILNDGVLHFEDANAQINGNVIVWGEEAHLTIINSQMFFPQSYLYHRKLMCMEGGSFYAENSTLNYSGLSHELIVYGKNSSVTWRNITNIGFTTWGVSGQPMIDIDETNQAGEFVILDSASISIKNASEILLWHHIPEDAEIVYAFPDGSDIELFEFNNQDDGIENIGYSYKIEDCLNVMWGFMPEPGSICDISNTYIKALGVWFTGDNNYSVSGLVNNSDYTSFSAPLSEHNINLTNSQVEIWSLYFFDNATATVSNSILGEIGTFDNSVVDIDNCLVDGSGGYIFSNDNSFKEIYNTYLNCDLISRNSSFSVFAYGGQNWGRTIANEYSIMIVIQPNLSAPPEFNDNAMVWYLKLEGQSTMFSNSKNNIIGSAWIDKASDYYSTEMDFFQIDYRSINDDNWNSICGPVYEQVYSSKLCEWDTDGIEPGSYVLRITMCDMEGESIEAVRVFNLEIPTRYKEEKNNSFSVYPNPAQDYIKLNSPFSSYYIKIFDNTGKVVLKKQEVENEAFINVSNLQSGIYMLQILSDEGEKYYSKIIKK